MIRIFYIFFAFSILVNSGLKAQSPGWAWAKSAHGSTFEQSTSLAQDHDGFIYNAGFFGSPVVDFDNKSIYNFANFNTADYYIVKYSPMGSVNWAIANGGSGDEYINDITVDAFNNLIITGLFTSQQISIGSSILTRNQFSSASEMFVAKYDSSGNGIWGFSATGILSDHGLKVSVDAAGNIYAIGRFNATLHFGTDSLVSNGVYDGYLFKLDPLGNVLWAKQIGGTKDDSPRALVVDSLGDIYVCGDFYSTVINLGTVQLNNATSAFFNDLFIIKYDPAGNVVWAKTIGGSGSEYAKALGIDSKGNVIAGGTFSSQNLTIGSSNYIKSGGEDMFLVKYDSGGAVLGSVTVGGLASSQVELGGLTIDGDDNLIIAGSFDSPTLQIGSTSLNSAGNYDILIAKYDSSMNPLWAKSVGGNLDEFVTGISDQGNGNIIISGHFNSGTLVFGGIILFNTDPPDVFIAALSSSVGVESLDHESKLIVWPNPSNGLINIEGQHKFKEVSIVDCLGRVIEIKHPNSATATISIGKRGIYILKVITDQSVICKTVIVNRD